MNATTDKPARLLWDSQWTNCVNHARAYEGWATEDAVHHAVKMAEDYIRGNIERGEIPAALATPAPPPPLPAGFDPDAPLPCSVKLPPATTVAAGCKFSTLLLAIDNRRKWGVRDFPATPPPPAEPAAEGREALAAHLHKLIGEYWGLAYREGQENRTHDTEDGAAGRCLHEIQHTIKLLATHPAEASAQGGEIGWPPPFEMRLCEQNHVILKPNRVYVFTVDQECDECRRLAAACDPAAFVDTPAPPLAPERAEPQGELDLPRGEAPLTHDERSDAEQAYSLTAFDYVSAPVGSRDWSLYWRGWWHRATCYTAPQAAAQGEET